MQTRLCFIVESKGKARVIRNLIPEAEVVVTRGSVFDLSWTPIRVTGNRLQLKWFMKRPIRLVPGRTYFLATDPDEEGELQARLIQLFFEPRRVSFIRVHLFSLDPEELRRRFVERQPADEGLSEKLYRVGLARRVYDRTLALFFAQKGIPQTGRTQAGILHLLAEPLVETRYVHSFFASGHPGGVHVFSNSSNPAALTVRKVQTSRRQAPPLSLARALARCGLSGTRALENLYLSGAITYPRVSPGTWEDLPPPITPRRIDLPTAPLERKAFEVVWQANETRELELRTIETEEGLFITEVPWDYCLAMPDLVQKFGTRSAMPPVTEGDVLRQAEVVVHSEKPLWWLLPEADERFIARPAYLGEVFSKLEKKGLISKGETGIALTEKGDEIRVRTGEVFPEIASPDFGRRLMARLREEEGVIRGSPEEPEILDRNFLEITTSLLKEVKDVYIRSQEPGENP